MKKRLFLVAVFIILSMNTIIHQEIEERYYNTYQAERETIITEKTVSLDNEDAVVGVMPDFIVPVIFFFSACIFTFTTHTEFKIGTVVWKPKYRKQLPRGNLA